MRVHKDGQRTAHTESYPYLGPAGVMWVVPLDELEHKDGTLRQQIVVLRFFLRHALVLFPGKLSRQTDSDGKVPW